MISRRYLFVIGALIIFAIQDAVSKLMVDIYPAPFLIMIRFLAFAGFAVLYTAHKSGSLRLAFQTSHPGLQLARGVILGLQVVVVVQSFHFVGLAFTQSILASAPVLITLASMTLLGERVRTSNLLATVSGLIGAIVILGPAFSVHAAATLFPIAAAAMFAAYGVATRYVSLKDRPPVSFLYTGIGGAIATTAWGLFHLSPIAAGDLPWIGLLCITGSLGHYLLILAYDRLPASSVQPLMYAQVALSGISAVLFFGEDLSVSLVIGAAIVVSSGVFAAVGFRLHR